MAQHEYFHVFIVHRGPESKVKAVELQDTMRKHGINAFVDETGLKPGTLAERQIKANLHLAKAAIVLFTAAFFESPWCIKELEYVLELQNSGLRYIPVFFTQTVDQVFAEARKIHGSTFAHEVTGTTGIRFQGERHRDWEYAAKQVCQAVLKVPNIKKPVGSLAANLHVDCKSPWQRQQEEFIKLRDAASAAAAAAAEFTEAPDVWILSHADTQHLAKKIEIHLRGEMPLSTFRVLQPDEGAKLEQHAAQLLAAEVAVVVFCECFFVDDCRQLLRLMATYPRAYIAVCYTVTEQQLRTAAVDAGGTDFAEKVVPPQCSGSSLSVVVAHQGGTVFRQHSDTIKEVCTHVQRMCSKAAALAASKAKSWSCPWAWLWSKQSTSSPPHPVVSGVVHKSSTFNAADHRAATLELSSTLVGATSSATGWGSIVAVSELSAGFTAGPLLLDQSVRSWADAAAAADTAAAASTRVFAASAGGGMVARCQQGWGLTLPPGAVGLPSLHCPAPILGVDTASPNSNGVLLPLSVSWNDSVGRCGSAGRSSAGSSPDSGNVGGSNDVVQHGAVVVSDGLQLHNLQLTQCGDETGVMLPRMVLDSQKLLLLSLGSCSYWHSDVIPLLVLEAPPAVINELNKMVLAHPDIPVVERLYHVLLQPGSQLERWAEDAAKSGLRDAAADINAASRATAAYHLLVLAIDQEAVLAAEWLLGMLARLHSAATSSASTLSVLLQQQRLASEGGDDQEKLWLLAEVRGEDVQQLFISWSEQHTLRVGQTGPVAQPGSVDCVNLLQQTVAAMQQKAQMVAAAQAAALSAEWSQIGNEPCMLQASSFHEMMTALGPAGDLAAAVLAGSLSGLQGLLLKSRTFSQQQLDEALEVAAMLGRVELLQLLLQHGADPHARGAAALAWAKQRIGEPQVLAALAQGHAAASHSGDMGSTSGTGSGSVYNLAVAAWCLGLHDELSGLRAPGAPQPQLQSLQQFLSSTTAEQRTVANLLAQLQQQWPELFVTAGPVPAQHDQDRIKTSPAVFSPTASSQAWAEVSARGGFGVRHLLDKLVQLQEDLGNSRFIREKPKEPATELGATKNTLLGEHTGLPVERTSSSAEASIQRADNKQRIALVIGVSEYTPQYLHKLPNAAQDALLVKELLAKSGRFAHVIECINPTRVELLRALYEFKQLVDTKKNNCIALLFYAGHGLVDKETKKHYMLPIDWDTSLGGQAALHMYGVEVEGPVGALATMSQAYAGIALFDACRVAAADRRSLRGDTGDDNGQPAVIRGWGDTDIAMPSDGKLLACYSSAPRRPANDGLAASPFAEAILKHLCSLEHPSVMRALSAVTDQVWEKTKQTSVPQQPQLQMTHATPFDQIVLWTRELHGVEKDLNELLKRLADPHKSTAVRQKAADDMWPFTWGDEAGRNMAAMVKINAIPAMVSVLKDNSSPLPVRGRICNIFQNLATVDAHRNLLISEGAVPLVVKMFSTVSAPERGTGWGALGNMYTELGREQAVAGGGVEFLIGAVTAWASKDSSWGDEEELRYLAAVLDFLQRSLIGHSQSGQAKRIASSSSDLRTFLAEVQQKQSTMKAAGENGVKAVEAAEVLLDWLEDPIATSTAVGQ